MRVVGFFLFCKDIRKLAAFYRDVVGLQPDDPQPFPEHKFYRFSADGGAALCLHSGTKPNGGRQKLIIHADDIDALIARLKKDRRSFRPPKANTDGDIMFDFFDPEGNRIQVAGKTKKS